MDRLWAHLQWLCLGLLFFSLAVFSMDVETMENMCKGIMQAPKGFAFFFPHPAGDKYLIIEI